MESIESGGLYPVSPVVWATNVSGDQMLARRAALKACRAPG